MRRRRRGLGGTEAEHRTDFIMARAEALEAASDATEAMKVGHCLVAGTRIDNGYVAVGRMQASSIDGKDISETARVMKAIKKADEPFEKGCVRSEPINMARTQMAWSRPGLAGYGTKPVHGRLALERGQWFFVGKSGGLPVSYALDVRSGSARATQGPAEAYLGFGRRASAVVYQGGAIVGSWKDGGGLGAAPLALPVPAKLHLKSVLNPDMPHSYQETFDYWVKVSSLEQASRVARDVISASDLGAGNWAGGELKDAKGRVIAFVSYNGRVWAGAPSTAGLNPHLLFDPRR